MKAQTNTSAVGEIETEVTEEQEHGTAGLGLKGHDDDGFVDALDDGGMFPNPGTDPAYDMPYEPNVDGEEGGKGGEGGNVWNNLGALIHRLSNGPAKLVKPEYDDAIGRQPFVETFGDYFPDQQALMEGQMGFIDTDESVPAKEAKAGEVHANNKEGVKKKKCKGATKDAGGALDLNVFCRWMIFLNWAAPSDFNSTFDPDEIKKDYPSAQGHFTRKSSFGNAEMPAYEPCKTWL